MSVLIDPYMLNLSNEQDIKNNLLFFRKIIRLSTKQRENGIRIAVYTGMLERIRRREIQPFPIRMELIHDRELKTIIVLINNKFNQILLNEIESLDIDECEGEQKFTVLDDKDLLNDDDYYEMLSVLLSSCYSQSQTIETRILTGNKKDGKKIGDTFQLCCSCVRKQYLEKYKFSGIDEFVPPSEKAVERIREKKTKNEILISKNVLAEMGNHHNHVQASGKSFHLLDELSTKNKRVLKLLQGVGLRKIIFENFAPEGSKSVGSMYLQKVDEKDTQDIVKAKFFAETEFQYQVELYFPKGIGQLLQDYFQGELLTCKNVGALLERIN